MERRVSRIRVDGRLADVVSRPPVITLQAREAGPVAIVTANVHGDEVTGVLAAHALDQWLQKHLKKGTVHLCPSLNPSGLAHHKRGLDGTDLNRMFPGDAAGGHVERLAHAIWRDLVDKEPAILIDLHADSSQAIPYAIVDRPITFKGRARAEMDNRLVAIAATTGLTVLRDYPADQYQRFGLDKSLAGAMVNVAKVVAVTIEAGPRRVADAEAVQVAIDAVKSILGHFGLVAFTGAPHTSRAEGGPWRRSTSVRAREEGLFVPLLAPGAAFDAGDVIGEVRAVSGDILETVRALEPGIVVSWPDAAWVPAGSSVGTLGVAEVPE